MPKLRKDTYFTPNNKYLTHSKIKDFNIDKQYFFQKHILCSLPKKKQTDPMLIGSAVDLWLTSSEKDFRDKYMMVSRRDTSNEYQLNPTQYQKIEEICRSVESQDAYKALKTFKTQKILQFDMPIGEHFIGIAGIPDFLKVKDGKAIIVDLKTNSNINPDKYLWECMNMGYLTQLAMYGLLLKLNDKTVKEIEYRHIVVSTTDDLHPVYTFKFAQSLIESAIYSIKQYIKEILEEKLFLPRNVSWDDAVMVGTDDEF